MMVMHEKSPFIPAAEEPGTLGKMATTLNASGRRDSMKDTQRWRAAARSGLLLHLGTARGGSRAGRQPSGAPASRGGVQRMKEARLREAGTARQPRISVVCI